MPIFRKGNTRIRRWIYYKVSGRQVFKERLTREEFEVWRAAEVPEELKLYRDAFSAMVFLRGMRVRDFLQLQYTNYQDDRIVMKEQKTGKMQSIVVIPDLAKIIEEFNGHSKWYLFPILKQVPRDPKEDIRYQRHIEAAALNKNYKLIAAYAGIQKKITNHISRHNFASFADRSGLDSRTISKMLNHSSLKVTEQYLGELCRADELDEAVGKIWK